jgi:tryptophan synthase alpha chain
MGITGTRDSVDDLAKSVVASVRNESNTQNTAVGIGISSAEQVSDVNSYADGAIVGSAFIKAYSQGGINALKDKVRELAAGNSN